MLEEDYIATQHSATTKHIAAAQSKQNDFCAQNIRRYHA